MCVHCGCGGERLADGIVIDHSHGPHEHHDHTHDHDHAHGPIVSLETRILAKNDALAARNRDWFGAHGILALNLLSAPGAGKTTLLERTIRDLGREHAIHVLEGDQATALDGDRIRAAGAPAVQLNTGTGCHLEADMVAQGVAQLQPPDGALLFIENVGNLVCPALFDLGERAKIVILSVTEGEDKPLKYPHMFRAASLLVINKIDLLPHVDFDVGQAVAHARAVNPELPHVSVSARSGEGLATWYDWIRHQMAGLPRTGFVKGAVNLPQA